MSDRIFAGSYDGMFTARSPMAAAIQTAVVLAWATECALATLESLEMKKSASKYDLKRHASICETLVRHCRELAIPPQGLDGRSCPRLAEALGWKGSPQGASGNQATARSDKHETETGVGVEPRPQDRQEGPDSSSSEPSASGGAVQRAADGDRE